MLFLLFEIWYQNGRPLLDLALVDGIVKMRMRILDVVPSHRILLVVNLSIEYMTLLLKVLGSHFHGHVHHHGLPSESALILVLLSLLVERDEAHVIGGLQLVV